MRFLFLEAPEQINDEPRRSILVWRLFLEFLHVLLLNTESFLSKVGDSIEASFSILFDTHYFVFNGIRWKKM